MSHFLPWLPRPDDVLKAGESALRAAYAVGFKDGLLIAVVAASLFFLLFRRRE